LENNEHNHSCIPAGEYLLQKRCSPKFGNHLLVTAVPNRNLILIHPANNAAKELQGCIAPVSVITGPGTGNSSKAALSKLLKLIGTCANKEKITLVITPAT
jgi:hypothetical protein